MGIISNITGIFHHPDAQGIQNGKDKKDKTPQDKPQDIMSKEASDALSARAKGVIKAQEQLITKNCSTKKMTGSLFPDVDNIELCKRYIETRKEAKEAAVETTKKIIKTFKSGKMGNVYDKDGNITAIFSKPDNNTGDFANTSEFCSYKMTEYDPITRQIKAVTKIFNHDTPGFGWDNKAAPYMERYEYSLDPKENTYLKVAFSKKPTKNGTMGLVPSVEIYAKGYKSDGELFGKRKADKFLSSILYDNYESYRENYTAPQRIFEGSIRYEMPSITQTGGLDEEDFDAAVEYPQKQMQLGEELMFINFPYVYEKKD